MKLIFIIVRDVDAECVVQTLVSDGYRVTRVASTGGFLQRGNVTLMAGVEDGKIRPVIELVRESCGPAEEPQHRATIFVVDMPYFEQV
jgi:uncharacterized protein YaaQ